MNSCFIDVLQGRKTERPPIWLMRQAGRYLPEYRKLREKYSFLEMVHQSEIAAEVTLQPIRRFQMDAAILFSDILVIAEALGFTPHFVEGVGPVFEKPLTHHSQLVFDAKAYQSSLAAIRLLKKELSVPLIGFAGAPFTVASYLIEGTPSKDLKKTKLWMAKEPESFAKVIETIREATESYLSAQVEAGVDALQLFESAASHLNYEAFLQYSVAPQKKLITQSVPMILFGRGSVGFISDLVNLSPRGISVDWSCDLAALRRVVPKEIVLQGNFDPYLLLGPKERVRQECRKMIRSMKGDSAYIFNLGHGVLPETPIENVHCLVEEVHAG